ncbi:MAG: chemotaxis protein CheW [Gemmatimonadales bacterium]
MTGTYGLGASHVAANVERMQLVTFRVGEELFAADVMSVERVLRYTAPRPIPNVPAWLEGVIDYRGRVVPVIDMRARFELGAATGRESARILVVAAGDDWIGAIVDGVEEVRSVPVDRLSPPPAFFKGLAKSYLRAIVRPESEDGAVIVVLDAAQLLTARERIVLGQAVADASANG